LPVKGAALLLGDEVISGAADGNESDDGEHVFLHLDLAIGMAGFTDGTSIGLIPAPHSSSGDTGNWIAAFLVSQWEIGARSGVTGRQHAEGGGG
jgi:hypothetical protein